MSRSAAAGAIDRLKLLWSQAKIEFGPGIVLTNQVHNLKLGATEAPESSGESRYSQLQGGTSGSP